MIGSKESEPARQGRPRAFDRDHALGQAVRVFWSVGYEGASLDALTKAMGINRSSLYQAFKDKNALFMEAVSHYERTVGRVASRALLDNAGPLRTDLRAFFHAIIRSATEPGSPRGCMFTSALPDVAEAHPEVRAYLRSSCQSAEAFFIDRFRKAIAEGDLPELAPAPALATLATGLMHSLSLRARAGEPAKDLRRAVEECLVILAPEPT